MDSTKNLFILIAIIFLTAGVGAGVLISVNFYKNQQINPTVAENIKSQQETQQKDMQKIPEATMPKFLYNLIGSIQRIEGNSIILEANVPYVNEVNQIANKIETRKAIVNPETDFSRIIFKDTGDAGRKTVQESKITLEDLKVGDQIEVIANKDIKNKQEFEVVSVRILP
ncbi:hypothetical protein L6267_04395 [Candidatus Parcubacteria bacterium]|nr:hypothetical protein [Candidatus Parcubacteria bacterium]